MLQVLKNYQKKLTNLSRSNRSLFLLKLSVRQDIDLHALDYVHSGNSFSIIKSLLEGKKKIPLCQVLDSRNEHVTRVSERLRQVQKKAAFIYEEQGTTDLYLGWPFVKGKLSNGASVRAPLLFFSVKLSAENNQWYLSVADSPCLAYNRSFLMAYAQYNHIALPEALYEADLEELLGDATEFRTKLYHNLKENGVQLQFNSDLFIDKLQNFKDYLSADFDEQHAEGELKLFPEAVLGIFQQAGSYLEPDYEYLISQNGFPDMEAFFLERGSSNETPQKEESLLAPLPLDISQENALKAIKQGRSVIVQGPPGTGKSQLIANVVCDFISRSKKVLVVCQKRAALDVVYKRLAMNGLGDFISVVHDFKNDRKTIYEQLARQIQKVDAYKKENMRLDTVHLERDFLQVSRKIDHITEELHAFKHALFDTNECGISVKELYLTSDPSLPHIPVTEYRQLPFQQWKEFGRKLDYLWPYAVRFDQPPYLWHIRKPFVNYTRTDLSGITEAVRQACTVKKSWEAQLMECTNTALSLNELWSAEQAKEDVLSHIEKLSEDGYAEWVRLYKRGVTEKKLLSYKNKLQNWQNSWLKITRNGVLSNPTSVSLETIAIAVIRANKLFANPVSKAIWFIFSKDRKLIKTLVKENNLPANREGLSMLSRYVDNAQQLEQLRAEIAGYDWTSAFTAGREIDSMQTLEEAISYGLWLQQATTFAGIISFKNKVADYKKDVKHFYHLLSTYKQQYAALCEYLHVQQLDMLLTVEIDPENYLADLFRDFDALCEYDTAKHAFSTTESKLYAQLLSASVEDVSAFFENSIRLAWIQHIEHKYPQLRAVSTLRQQQMETELLHLVKEKRALSTEIVLLKVQEQAYATEKFNRLGNRLTYRELAHQVTKKKKIWPLRKLTQEFHSEIFDLVPCWLASPETVSAIFPMEPLFDVLIFDEASQCFAEKSIPAMYRARQVVIVGDSKQLPPTDIYQVRWSEDIETEPDTEIDSLLSLGEKYLYSVTLTGHYRSHSLDLIEFSNRHFYDNKLQVLPDYEEYRQQKPHIRFVKVEGTWHQNHNKTEAERVVELVGEYLTQYPDKEIGIVTFNCRQQDYIYDLLHREALVKGWILPPSLIVKNIENIQGDEKDLIIFSTGYAADANGKLFMHFGSLNSEGGENRLNVAITRARENILIVSSILPQQLHTENLTHKGPQLFKQYMEYAISVSEGKYTPHVKTDNVPTASWYLKKKLVKNKVRVSDLPFADITEHKENGEKLLLLTDDDLYYESTSAKHDHAYLLQTLKDKNWHYKRIYSRQYWLKEISF